MADNMSELSEVSESEMNVHGDECSNNNDAISPSKKEKIKVKKKKEAGVLYLSTIPPFMTVRKVREILGQYGEVDRIFLQPENKGSSKKPSKHFTEGWVEFKDKKVAKNVAALLNNKLIGGKRRSRFHDCIWNLKYLHRFKWVHLNERLAYEKAMYEQRLRTEISQVKRETNFFINAVEKNNMLQKLKRKKLLQPIAPFEIAQRSTDQEIRDRKMNKNKKDGKNDTAAGTDKEFLKTVFGGDH